MLGLLSLAPSARGAACGSRRAFVDLGANDGQSLGWFERNHLKPSSPYTAVYAFEMNPYFEPSLRASLSRLPGGQLERAAAWVRDGTMQAHMQACCSAFSPISCWACHIEAWECIHWMCGAHAHSLDLPGSRTAVKGGVLYNMTASALQAVRQKCLECWNPNCRAWNLCTAEQRHESVLNVPTIDFAAWLSSHFCKEDHVFVKVDIEGAEFEVFEHLLTRGVAELIDIASIEWHTEKRGAGRGGSMLRRQRSISNELQHAGVKLTTWGDARSLRREG
ncbi:MAG: hypothetical protein SGPRY_002192 [Prymnesium sp.]